MLILSLTPFARASTQLMHIDSLSGSHGGADFASLAKEMYANVPSLQQQTGLSSTNNCTNGTEVITFEVKLLLNLIGRPNLVSETDIAYLEESFVTAYNNLQNCSLPGTSRILDAALINYIASNTTVLHYQETAIQEFAYLVVARGRSCNFCGNNATIFLFNNVSSTSSGLQNGIRNRELHKMVDFPRGKEYDVSSKSNDSFWQFQPAIASELSPVRKIRREETLIHAGFTSKSKKRHQQDITSPSNPAQGRDNKSSMSFLGSDSDDLKTAFADSRRLQNGGECGCQEPDSSRLTNLMSKLLYSASASNLTSLGNSSGINFDAIAGIVGATELLPVHGCNANNRSDFNTTAILRVAFASAQNLTQVELANIAFQIKQSYQAVNSLNSQVCDPFFRQVTGVQYNSNLSRRRLSSSLNTTAGFYNVSYNVSSGFSNTNYGNSTFTAGVVDLVFVVSGTCSGCPSNTPLFNSVTARRRMQQQGSAVSVATTTQYSPGETTCLCPTGASQTGPTLQDFTQALNISLTQLPVNSSAGNATLGIVLLQVVNAAPSPCTSVIETFPATILVPLTVDPNITTWSISAF